MFGVDILAIQTVIFFLTLLVGAIYAGFTLGILKNSAEQSRQSLLPLPVIYVRENGTGGQPSRRKVFRIRNIGYGAALNIKIEPFILNSGISRSKKLFKNFSYVLKMQDPNILVKDEEKDLTTESFLDGKLFAPGDDLLFPHLHSGYATKNIPLEITYQDVKGRIYKIKIAFGTGRLNVIEFPKEDKSGWLFKFNFKI